MAERPEEGVSAAGDPRPDLPRIALGAPLEGHWVKIDTDQLRMSDFETLELVQQLGAGQADQGTTQKAMTKLLRLMRHVVMATSLPGETIEEALGELRPAEFTVLTAALSETTSVPNGS